MNPHFRIALVLAIAAASGLSGCNRTPPTPQRVEPSAPAVAERKQLRRSATDDSRQTTRRIIRDEAVAPATLEVAVIPKSEQELAADALTRIGPPAVPTLVQALQNTDNDVRRQACAVLMRMGPDAKEAVPELVALLDDPDEELRRMAAIALGRIGPDAGQAVPKLMQQMLSEGTDGELRPLDARTTR